MPSEVNSHIGVGLYQLRQTQLCYMIPLKLTSAPTYGCWIPRIGRSVALSSFCPMYAICTEVEQNAVFSFLHSPLVPQPLVVLACDPGLDFIRCATDGTQLTQSFRGVEAV